MLVFEEEGKPEDPEKNPSIVPVIFTAMQYYCTSLFQAIGSYSTGLMDIEDLKDIECHSIPGAGTCGKYVYIGLNSCFLITCNGIYP